MNCLPPDSRLCTAEFIFGTATAAFQIEGANTADGRAESIWDRFCATPGKVKNGHTGANACEHYTRWQTDLDLIQSLGVDAYRFSIAWPRIFSSLNSQTPNAKGLDFYKRLVDALNERGIKPFATLYHWDLPQYLEQRGGWLNRDTAFRFADYAECVTRHLGTEVASWTTLNEPWCSSFLSYQHGIHAPGYQNLQYARQAAHHLLLAHGLAMQVFRSQASQAENGLVLNLSPAHAATNTDKDTVAAAQSFDDNHRWFLDALFNGHYPENSLARHPEAQPLVLPGDFDLIRAPMDFMGINYYTRDRITATNNSMGYAPVPCEPHRPHTAMGWEIYPDGLTEILLQIHREYQLPPVYITENGMASEDQLIGGEIQDLVRTRYLQDHWLAVDQAIRQGVDVRGWFAWSLMDNFEWAEGYNKRFGLYYVDYHTQQRYPKQSAIMLREFLRSRRTANLR